MKKAVSLLLVIIMALSLCACTAKKNSEDVSKKTGTVLDCQGREVVVPEKVERIVCVGVGALRYTCYMGCADLVVGVEDYETKAGMSRLYNYVNYERFKDLPVIGTNGVPNIEEIIKLDAQVIVVSAFANVDADELSEKTGVSVVMVPGSDTTLDGKAYETIRIMGELYDRPSRAEELTTYLKGIEADLNRRTCDISEAEKPSVYVGGVSFKGTHGFSGTEAFYGPFELIGAKNVANETGQNGAFDVEAEKVLVWDPDIIFLDFNGLELIKADYLENPGYYNELSAFKGGRVYSQISFRSSAVNLETSLADAYYAASIIYPKEFFDIDPVVKAGEIFEMLLGTNPYNDLKGSGYEFRQITLGE